MAFVDQFLSRFYRSSEKRSGARPVSLEADQVRATFEQAQHAHDAYTWALCVLGSVHLSQLEEAVLRAYYLWLSPAHVAIIERRFGRDRGPVSTSKVEPGSSPPEAADLQSYCDWSQLAKHVGLTGRHARRVAMATWGAARDRVSEALASRGLTGPQEVE